MIEAYPLCWPVNKPRTEKAERKTAVFGKMSSDTSSYSSRTRLSIYEAVTRVKKELDGYTKVGKAYRVDPDSIVISTNIPVKKDGTPYSNFKEPDDNGVAVYFELDGKQYCLPCDKWDRVADNLAAVAAHLNAMRGIERWGVGESHDVYTGFAALPEVSSFNEQSMWQELGLAAKPAAVRDVHDAYRHQVKIVHPDIPNTGSAEKFYVLQQAYKQALQQYNQ